MLGHSLSPDDAYLALRGLRTMSLRLEHQQRSALELARWLDARPEVVRVLHPALPSDPGHEIWRRDFTGASGLFAFVLPPSPREALAACFDGLELFGMGFSWGGYESLILPGFPSETRTAARWDPARGSAGFASASALEDVRDLRGDLEGGLERWRRATGR